MLRLTVVTISRIYVCPFTFFLKFCSSWSLVHKHYILCVRTRRSDCSLLVFFVQMVSGRLLLYRRGPTGRSYCTAFDRSPLLRVAFCVYRGREGKGWGRSLGGGVPIIMHGRSRTTIDARIPTYNAGTEGGMVGEVGFGQEERCSGENIQS